MKVTVRVSYEVERRDGTGSSESITEVYHPGDNPQLELREVRRAVSETAKQLIGELTTRDPRA